MRCGGIDEAGLGPTIGPLSIVLMSAEVDEPQQIQEQAVQVAPKLGDSKKIYTAGRLAPLEEVCLSLLRWIYGYEPATAAELFALLGEQESDRQDIPWMQGAADLHLPISDCPVHNWEFPGWHAPILHGFLVHPLTLNDDKEQGINRSACELRHIQQLLSTLNPDEPFELLIDRLGGRRYYQESLQGVWPEHSVAILAEGPGQSDYAIKNSTVSFAVGGESLNPFTAMASCIAKYSRECHMKLLNQHWCEKHSWLKPTAGYPEDAKRWLFQLGEGTVNAWRRELVRL